jgi:hypothetical protein
VADLVSLDEAKRQLRWADSDLALRMEELQALIDQATAIVLALCNTTAHWREITVTWTDSTVPVPVKTAILKQVAYLNQFRGDDPKGSMEDDGLAPGVRALLRFTSDPVVV